MKTNTPGQDFMIIKYATGQKRVAKATGSPMISIYLSGNPEAKRITLKQQSSHHPTG